MITIKATGDTTLYTAGKYCEEDILVQVPEGGGIELPELINEGAAADLMIDKELIDGNGNKITGTFTIENEVNAQNSLIAQIKTALQDKASATSTPTQEKTVEITTNGTVTVVPDDGYALSKVTANVNVASSGGGGGGSNLVAQLLENSEIVDNEVTEINKDVFRGWQYMTKLSLPNVVNAIGANGYLCYGCTKLEEVYMPKCATLGGYSFYNNTALETIDFPSLTTVPANCFRQCTSATSVNLPLVTSLGNNAFQKDALIEKLDLPLVTSIGATAFDQCSALVTVILRKNQVCTLSNVSAFNNTPIKSGTGYIYVPASLKDQYASSTNWSTYSAQIRAIEDYPDICGM